MLSFLVSVEQRLWDFVDGDGAAQHMVFWGEVHGEEEVVGQRVKTFRGVNGLFFTLMVLRTALPLRVISTLFGVHETTGGRAFTTWLNFLYRSFKPLVRLPTRDEVSRYAPDNFRRQGLKDVAMVLDASEVWINSSWQTDLNWAC